MEQVPHDVRGITGVCKSRLSEGALLRAEVQGAESGQGDVGILHQTIRLSRTIPSHRHQLQPSCEGTALPFSEKKAMALLYKLEKHTIDLVKLSREIVALSREMYAKWEQSKQG